MSDAAEWAKLSPNSLELASEDDISVLEAGVWDAVDDRCKLDPLFWLQEITFTENPQAEQMGLNYRSHFPKKSYLKELFKAFNGEAPYLPQNPNRPRVFIPKTRDMMTSWAAIGYVTHKAQWNKWEALVQTDSLDKAMKLLDYAHQLYRNQPPELQAKHSLLECSKQHIAWGDGGEVSAIPVGEHKIRARHPTVYIMDEAAFLLGAEQLYNAAHPVCWQIIAISSAGPGWFGNECQK